MANTSLMEYLNGIATAVQAKTGSTKKIKLKDIASEIAKIDTFGTHEFLDPITVTTNGIFDVKNYSSINVQVVDVDDLAAYFADDGVEDSNGDRHYSVVYKDYGTHWNSETQQNETIGYTSKKFELGAYNFACLQYNSSDSIHNETLYFDQLDNDEIIIQNHNLSGETVTELEVVRLADGDGAYIPSTHLAYYNTSSRYVDVYDSVVSSGDILVFNGDGFSSLSGSSTDVLAYNSSSEIYQVSLSNKGAGLINDGEEVTRFNLGTNNIMYNSSSSIYNDALLNYEVTYYDNTESDTYKIKTKDLTENSTSVLFYNQNQSDGNGIEYTSYEINTVLFKDLCAGDSDLKALYPSADQYGNYVLQIGKIGYESSGSGESYILAEWAGLNGTYIGVGHIGGSELAYTNGSNGGLSTVNFGQDGNGGETIIYGADDGNNSFIPTEITFPNHRSIFYYNSSGEATVSSLQNNIAYLQGSTVYTQGFADTDVIYYNSSGEFTISTLGSNEVVHQNSSSGMEVEYMSASSVGYFSNGRFNVVNFDNSGYNGGIAYYNGSNITIEYMSSYNSSWSYDSSSQNTYGKIRVNGSLVDITEDMLKALVDAGFFTSAS